MAPPTIRGFARTWSKGTGMTNLKEALIQMVEGEKESRLVVIFNSGRSTRVFQLSNNTTSMVLRHSREEQSSLHLTFQKNCSLFIDKLSCGDAEKLKKFLDRVHQKTSQLPMKSRCEWVILGGGKTQEKSNKIPFHKVGDKPSNESFSLENGSGTSVLQEMPLLMSKSSTLVRTGLLENPCGKRKRMPSSDVKMHEDFLKENNPVLNKKSKTDPLKCISNNRKEPLSLENLEKCNKSELGPLFNASSTGNPNLDGNSFSTHHLSVERSLAFPSEPNCSQNEPGQKESQMPSNSHLQQKRQGFPNLGNTCYMNAILQSLFAIPSFADDLLNQGIPWEKIPLDALIMCFSQLLVLKDLCDIEIKGELLVNIKNSISSVAAIFSDDMQNDAHEFLSQCLDQMKEDMEKLNAYMTERETGEEISHPQISAANASTKVFVCPVVTNFAFELQCSIICKACGEVVCKTELSNYLSINLSEAKQSLPSSIQYSFDLFFRAEEIEYKCEKCKHKCSVAMHKFTRLPRVLIVHLKRYIFNDCRVLVKDNQQVGIPIYLSLSPHCDENTKPPLPFSSNAHIEDSQVLKVSQEMISGTTSSWMSPMTSTSTSKDFLVPHIEPDKDTEPQKCQRLSEGSSQEQQHRDPENDSKLNITESELVNSRDSTASEKEWPAADSMIYWEDTSLSVICELGGKFTSSPVAGLVQAHHQEVPESPEPKTHQTTNASVKIESNSITQSTEDFYENKENRSPEESQGVVKQLQQCDGKRIYEKVLQQALPQNLRKPDAQEHTEEDLSRSTELSLLKDSLNSLRALGSGENPGNKGVLGMENTEAEAEEQKRNTTIWDPHHAYRLISVVSHLGDSPNSGHYVSDVYDFAKQAWFMYDDLKALQIQEANMQNDRSCNGYIFFYMHTDIFEELLRKAETSQSQSTESLAMFLHGEQE
ncbi:ubiquitin carboxyl-terminal hydrolase 29 [Loxodonta africana]|nr:ubiquitin carboxyl-terminal hydrolase 29 [Loxodonta africana]